LPQRKKAKNEVGKTPGTAVAPTSATLPKNKSWRRKVLTKNPTGTPAGNDNASTAASKKPRKKATGRKSGGKKRGKPTAARK
jgi:hypothetical protein